MKILIHDLCLSEAVGRILANLSDVQNLTRVNIVNAVAEEIRKTDDSQIKESLGRFGRLLSRAWSRDEGLSRESLQRTRKAFLGR